MSNSSTLIPINPFSDALHHLTNNIEKDHSDRQQQLKLLNFVLNDLSKPENKLIALQYQLSSALFTHYNNNIKSSTHNEELSINIRLAIINILISLTRISDGRNHLLTDSSIGFSSLLSLFQDSSPLIRIKICELYVNFISSADCLISLSNGDKILFHNIIKFFLNDSDIQVIHKLITCLRYFTLFNTELDTATLKKLQSLLIQNLHTNYHIIIEILHCLWNSSVNFNEKLVIIECGIIDTLSPLCIAESLDNNNNNNNNNNNINTTTSTIEINKLQEEIVRLSTGILMSLTIQQAAKKIVINDSNLVQHLCNRVSNTETNTTNNNNDNNNDNNDNNDNNPTQLAIRQNCVGILSNTIENPAGLILAGKYLIYQPETALEVMNLTYLSRYIGITLRNSNGNLSNIEKICILRAMQYCIKIHNIYACNKLWEILYLMQYLYNFTQSSDVLVVQIAETVVNSIIQKNTEAEAQYLTIKQNSVEGTITSSSNTGTK